MKKLPKKVEKTLEKFGFYNSSFKVYSDYYSDYVELEQHTPAGEDWCPCFRFNGATGITFSQAVREYANTFDVDEEVEPLIGMRGAPGIHILVHDAEWKEQCLNDLAEALKEVE